MQVLLAVLDDLFRFAQESLFGFVAIGDRKTDSTTQLAPLQPLLPLPQSKSPHVLPEFGLVTTHADSCFVGIKETKVRLDPVAAFDNVIATLTYGRLVTVLKYGGRWAMVRFDDSTGWVLKDDISAAAADVFPRFSTGSAYDADQADTKKLRQYIGDMFSCTDLALPLTSAEYITYRLLRANRSIQWTQLRPRLPGRWQTLLRGQAGVHMGIIPKTGAVMEYIHEDQGYLLYVEAVFPDESIQVSAVDHEGMGVYTESVLSKEVWRELRPVFIEVQ